MNFNFGTPARLERQIAQDLLASQSDFDLSVPGGDTNNISTSISRTPLGPSKQQNASFSRPSDNVSDSSKQMHAQPTPRASLASAMLNAQQRDRKFPASQSSVSSDSPMSKQRGTQLSSSSATSDASDSPQSPEHKVSYSEIRSDSPPLTSTPQRVGAPSTVGSRSRTTMTLRPPGNHTSSSYQNDLTSASRNMQSTRSASTVLDDLTESSIAPEDLEDRQSLSTRDPISTAGQDFVLHDAVPEAPDRSVSAPIETAQKWSSRRAERRKLVQADESTVYGDDSILPTDNAQHGSYDSREIPRSLTSDSERREDTATAYSSPAAARLARQIVPTGPPRMHEVSTSTTSTPSKFSQHQPDTPRASNGSVAQSRMRQYLLNSVRATEKLPRKGRSSDAQALDNLKAQADLHGTPLGSRSDGHLGYSSAASTLPTPKRRMDRLGKANTLAAGRTPLPKGSVAELLRRGALFGIPDSSVGSSAAAETPVSLRQVHDEDQQSNIGSAAGYSEASSIDLTAATNVSRHGTLGLRANTSFPGLGAAEAGTEANSFARPRVDAAKLALYQSKLNARLDAENEELKRERDALLQKVQTLEIAKSDLSPEEERHHLAQLKAEQEKSAALDKEAQDLADLLEVKAQEFQLLQQQLDDNAGQVDQELQSQLDELRTLLKERDEDVEDLEARLEQERQHMEEQVQQAKAYSFETLDKIEAARDEALMQVQALKAELVTAQRNTGESREVRQGDDHRDEKIADLDAQLQTLRTQLAEERANGIANHRPTESAGNGNMQASVRLERHESQGDTRSAAESEQREAQLAELQARARQLSEELEAAEIALTAEKAQSSDLRQRIADYEVDVKELEEDLNQANDELEDAEQRLQALAGVEADQSRIEELVAELAEAQQQVRTLQKENSETHQSKDRDEELALLREQKTELEKRVAHYRELISQNRRTTITPQKHPSPLPKSVQSLRNISAMKTPRSPGPLSSASWLYNESSLGAAGVNEKIALLETALDEANASIDAKLQQLDMVKLASDRDRLRAERDEIIRDVGMFETELKKLRLEADQQGQDLELLRAERDEDRRRREHEEREQDEQRADFLLQVQTLVAQLKSKTHEVDRIKAKLDSLERSRSSAAAPPPYIEPSAALAELKVYHEQECKGLMLQIKYLSLKLSREMDLRADLAHQKQYISQLLKGLSQADEEVGKIIFDLQFESEKRHFNRYKAQEQTVSKRWTKALTAVRAIVRMRGLAEKLQVTRQIKGTLQQAHTAVQSRRTHQNQAFVTAKKIRNHVH